MALFSRLVLGTAQWGMDYGIVGSPRMAEGEIETVLGEAAEIGVELLDTAPAYGRSEPLIGRLLETTPMKGVVTKISVDAVTPEDVGKSCRDSIRRLNLPCLYGLLVHRTGSLLGSNGKEIWKSLEALRAEGCTMRLGASVYEPEELARLLSLFPFDLVQLPLNVLDQRMIRSGLLERTKDLGVEVHARSVFLQGTLLLEPCRLPGSLAPLAPYANAFRNRAAKAGLSPLAAALAFAMERPEVDRVVVGIDSFDHFSEVVQAVSTCKPFDAQGLDVTETPLIDPRRWHQQR